LVDFTEKLPQLINTHKQPLPADLRHALSALCTPGEDEINRLGKVDHYVGKIFAETANALLAKTEISPAEIQAIGSHGQTVRHHPHGEFPFTLQIGDPNVIAELTG